MGQYCEAKHALLGYSQIQHWQIENIPWLTPRKLITSFRSPPKVHMAYNKIGHGDQ